MSARAKALAAWRDAVLSHDVFATFVTPGECPLASLAGGVLEQCVDVGSEDIWGPLSHLLAPIRPDVPSRLDEQESDDEREHVVIETLLWAAVCHSSLKKDHIKLIIGSLQSESKELMTVVQEQQALADAHKPLTTPASQGAGTNSVEAPAPAPTPAHVSSPAGSAAANANYDGISAADSSAELHATIDALQHKLDEAKEREGELAAKVHDLTKASLADEVRAIESEGLAERLGKEHAETSAKQEAAIARLSQELEAKDTRLRDLQDEIDVNKSADTKLSKAQQQLDRFRAKIEQLSDVKNQLDAEQEARAEAVERVLALELEVETIPALKKQLDEYKGRVTAADMEVRELKRALEQQAVTAESLESQRRALAEETSVHHSQARALQQELEEREAASPSKSAVAGVGLGVSELNNEVVEQIKRLTQENASLHGRLDHQSGENADRLAARADDAERLAASYEERLHETTQALESTRDELVSAKVTISELQDRLAAEKARCEGLRRELASEQEQHRDDVRSAHEEMAARDMAATKVARVAQGRATAAMELQRACWLGTCTDLESRLAETMATLAETQQLLADQQATTAAAEERERGLAADLVDLEASRVSQLAAERALADAAVKEVRESGETVLEVATSKHTTEMAQFEAKGREYMETHKVSNEQHKAALAAKDHQIEVGASQLRASEDEVADMEEKNRKLQRQMSMLRDELEEMGESGGGGGGGGGGEPADFEFLRQEYADVCTEIQALKHKLQSAPVAADTAAPVGRATRASSSSRSNLGEEISLFERRNSKLMDEKRELVMKVSAATSKQQQAEQERDKLIKALKATEDRVTALELQRERGMRQLELLKSRTPEVAGSRTPLAPLSANGVAVGDTATSNKPQSRTPSAYKATPLQNLGMEDEANAECPQS